MLLLPIEHGRTSPRQCTCTPRQWRGLHAQQGHFARNLWRRNTQKRAINAASIHREGIQDRCPESRSHPVTNGSLHHVWSSSRFLLISILSTDSPCEKFMSKFCRFLSVFVDFCQLFVNFLSIRSPWTDSPSKFCQLFVDFLSTFCQLFVNFSSTFSRPTFSRKKDGPSHKTTQRTPALPSVHPLPGPSINPTTPPLSQSGPLPPTYLTIPHPLQPPPPPPNEKKETQTCIRTMGPVTLQDFLRRLAPTWHMELIRHLRPTSPPLLGGSWHNLFSRKPLLVSDKCQFIVAFLPGAPRNLFRPINHLINF